MDVKWVDCHPLYDPMFIAQASLLTVILNLNMFIVQPGANVMKLCTPVSYEFS